MISKEGGSRRCGWRRRGRYRRFAPVAVVAVVIAAVVAVAVAVAVAVGVGVGMVAVVLTA
jgi:hypothetical protein